MLDGPAESSSFKMLTFVSVGGAIAATAVQSAIYDVPGGTASQPFTVVWLELTLNRERFSLIDSPVSNPLQLAKGLISSFHGCNGLYYTMSGSSRGYVLYFTGMWELH